jgi:ABC-type antimicrobial peptide transport system permease subunit
MGFGIITTFIAGLMPSIKAGKIDPVAILRG